MTIKLTWQLQTPLDAIIFDCDGTLSKLEGIDELAKHNGVDEQVRAMTAEAMGKTGINPELYQQRLHLVAPQKQQIEHLATHYFDHQVPDAYEVIQLFTRLNKSVYIVSAGVNPAVKLFGEKLQVPSERIFAVDLHFDQEGNYLSFDPNSPLIHSHGKRDIVVQLCQAHKQVAHIGDGLNDYVTYDLVTRFIGYGGVFYRENIAKKCEYYIHSLSLSPLLFLTLTQEEYEQLSSPERELYHKGLHLYTEALNQKASISLMNQ